MSNWAERGKQERERQAAESAAAQQALNSGKQNLERKKHEQRQFVTGKLGIYEQLGVPRLLEEVRRDIWKGFGKVDPIGLTAGIHHDEGYAGASVGAYLHADMNIVYADYEPAYTEHYGEYATDKRQELSGKWITYKTAEGNHKHYAGELITGVRESKKEITRLAVALEYQEAGEHHYTDSDDRRAIKLARVKRWPNRYLLRSSITSEELEFIDTDPQNPNPTLDIADARQALDKLLLKYAAGANPTPDFQALRVQSEEAKSFILRHVGKLTKDVPGLHEIEYKMRGVENNPWTTYSKK